MSLSRLRSRLECDACIAVADDCVVAAGTFVKFVKGGACAVDPGATCIGARGSKSGSVVGVREGLLKTDSIDRNVSCPVLGPPNTSPAAR